MYGIIKNMKKKVSLLGILLLVPISASFVSCANNNLIITPKTDKTYHVGDFFRLDDFDIKNGSDNLKIELDHEEFPDGSVLNDKGNYVFTITDEKNQKSTDINISVLSKEDRNIKKEDFTYYDLGKNASLPTLQTTGDLNVLVVPYIVKGFEANASQTNLDRIKRTFAGDSTNTNYESVSSFYKKSSYNKLNINFTVTDWFDTKMSPMDIYLENDKSQNDIGINYITNSCLEYYKTTYKDDATKFDNDKDGLIDAIWVISSAPNYTKNSYDSRFASMYWAFTYRNIPNYQLANILDPKVCNFSNITYDFMDYGYGTSGVDAHTFIHETGHLLGLLDYYSYNYDCSPMGDVDMMDYNIGDHNALSKYALGWVKPTVVRESKTITLKPFENDGSFILVGSKNFIDFAFDEYFTIEFITPTNLNEKDYLNVFHGVSEIQGYSKPGIRITHADNRGAYISESRKTISSDDTNKITKNYLTNTPSNNPKFLANPLYFANIMNKNYGSANSNPLENWYKKSDEALFFKGEKFSLNNDSVYKELMPSNSSKLNKYLMGESADNIVDFSVEVIDITETEATLKIDF
jgi:M6 family metalloprotease-like protein